MTKFDDEFIKAELDGRSRFPKLRVDCASNGHIYIKYSTVTLADVHTFGSPEQKFHDAESIVSAVNNYEDALDEIKRLNDALGDCEYHLHQAHMPHNNMTEAYRDAVAEVNTLTILQQKEEIQRLREVLEKLYFACLAADNDGDLSEYVDGELLDAANEALKGA